MLVVGAGGAGLVAALAAAEAGARVTVICDAPLGQHCNTAVSGGGFMMSTGCFSVSDHVSRTLQAGRLLNDEALVGVLCNEANGARTWIETKLDARFNPKDNAQGYWFTGGGAGFFERLRRCVAAAGVRVVEGTTVVELLVSEGRCGGAVGLKTTGEAVAFQAQATVLASGGYAGLYERHDNPGVPVGEGVVLALRAGVRVRDLEFVQFYPIGLAEPSLPTFMAFRPFPPQARVLNAAGTSLSEKYLDTDDLNEAIGSHRDRLAQAIERESRSGPVWLDLTGVDWNEVGRWFSLQFLSRYDFPWSTRPARIAPIAHHTMGGVVTDTDGRTDVPGLLASGEVAGGVHGANRLGSNSLSACLVFGRRAGRRAVRAGRGVGALIPPRSSPSAWDLDVPSEAFKTVQRICWEYLSLKRSAVGIEQAQAALNRGADTTSFKLGCARLLATSVAAFAKRREESRGAHCREDFPEENPAWGKSLVARFAPEGLRFDGEI